MASEADNGKGAVYRTSFPSRQRGGHPGRRTAREDGGPGRAQDGVPFCHPGPRRRLSRKPGGRPAYRQGL